MRYGSAMRRGAGSLTVLVAICLTTILGVVAIALDGGLSLDSKRRVQAAADAAALAAADDLFANYGTYDGVDTPGTAKASALSTAAANGFTNDGVTSTVTVNIPPASGNFTGKAGYAEVIVQYNQSAGFSAIFSSSSHAVSARAVSCGNVGNIGILCLDYDATVTAQIMGKVNILNGGQIYVNSNATEANSEFNNIAGSVYLGSGAALSTGGLNVYSTSLLNNKNGGSVTYTNGGSLKAFSPPITDPLANIAEPTPSGTTYGSTSSGYSVTTSTTLQPGIYPGGIQIGSGSGTTGTGTGTGSGSGGAAASGSSSNITVTLSPGIYYLGTGAGSGSSSASFTIGSNATVNGSSVMFYNQLGDNFSPFNGVVNITPPSSGTYKGISFWQPREDAMEIHISGSANMTMSGTWYNVGVGYATGELNGNSSTGEFDINPSSGVTYNIGNYICDQAEWQQGVGGSGGTIQMNPGGAYPTKRPTLVE